MSSDDEEYRDRRQTKFRSERNIKSTNTDVNREVEKQDSEADTFGPALPPHLKMKVQQKAEECEVYGPALPAELCHRREEARRREVIGPELPPHLQHLQNVNEDDEESEEEQAEPTTDEFYGPSPSLMSSGDTPYPILKPVRLPKVDSSGSVERESWMVELPKDRSINLGLGPRQFRTKLGPDLDEDNSSWTDTPSQKSAKLGNPNPKVDDKKMMKASLLAERDKEMEKLRKKVEKKMKRKETLMEIHEKKLKKQAKKEEKERVKKGLKPVERRPFNRDTDLQVNRFDEAQKRAVLKKAQLLDDRFSQGESKFL